METNSGLGGGAPKVNVQRRGWFRRFMAFVGPAYLVSIGYMDPGNWATDIEGGARFGYALLWVLLMSNLMALLLQTLASRLGIVTGYDLAQGCRREYPRALNALLWLFAEIAIAATDLAEVLGTIIGLQLLFGLPLLWGCAIAALDTFLLLIIQRFGVQKMEAFIVMMVGTIGACFFIEVFLAKPDWGGVVGGLVPSLPPSAVYVAIGIIGATVMPHNLYLHSSLVQSRAVANTLTGKREACKFNLLDTTIALNGAFLVNASIVIMAAAVADYRPRERAAAKLKRSAAPLTLELVPNPDILAGLGASRRGSAPLLVGFALETGDDAAVIAAAQGKLVSKRVDLVVANAAADALERADTRAAFVSGRGVEWHPEMPKPALADLLLSRAAELVRGRDAS